MTIYVSNSGGIRQSEGTDGADFGHFARRMSWVNSSSLIICYWSLGAHQCANFDLKFAWTDWCCHSGGGGNCRGTAASGYGAPGSLSEYNMHYDSHSFWLSASGNTIRLLCSGGNGSGPGNVFCGVNTTRSESFAWGS